MRAHCSSHLSSETRRVLFCECSPSVAERSPGAQGDVLITTEPPARRTLLDGGHYPNVVASRSDDRSACVRGAILRARGGGCVCSTTAESGEEVVVSPNEITVVTPPGGTAVPAMQDAAAPSPSHPPTEMAGRETASAGAAGEEAAPLTSLAASPPLATPLSQEMVQSLTRLDDRLVDVLERGDIRLVRSDWLLAQPEEYRIVRRQDLAPVGGVPPHLSPEEAAGLIRQGRRCVGVLTYGWPTAGNPDPTGSRVAALRRALEERRDIQAFFWDFPSLHQRPRTAEEGWGLCFLTADTCPYTQHNAEREREVMGETAMEP